ncbi:hypothetical protein GGX14DRAFT_592100 [Mycena pura]|uniref:Uncharacterized protein n=1 Tax=Mycena pura TaxID=153505 RepID=A0AAD6VSZ2_9AGAR|nr:hypothetical protein GGX14DRAFT_592100 [Mycena pura]
MYSNSRLDIPPQSPFRRPWSPDPDEPLPSGWNLRQHREPRFINSQYAAGQPDFQPDYDYGFEYPYNPAPRRREPSDVSVEALDLADYAMTLKTHQSSRLQGQYGDILYPPSPPAHRPLANRPPSAMSRMDTLSSGTHSSTTRGRNATRRPYSLPPSSAQSHTPRSANHHNYPYLNNIGSTSKQPIPSSEPEIDIAHFPAWSKNWYNSQPKAATASPPDIYTALPPSSWNPRRMPFDPGTMFRPDSFPQSSDPYDPYSHNSSSLGYDSTRDLLPWSSEPPDYGPTIEASLKEERIRMLEREFGPNAKGKGPAESNGDFLDENGKPLVGTVDSKGQLVTKGSRKRVTLRAIQVVLSLAAAIPAIYAALVIKPTGKPPPSGTIAAYILYVFSVLTVLLLLYLFVFRPCCCAGRRRKAGPDRNPLANGMMVLPVSGPGNKKNKANGKNGKNGKKGKNEGAGDVQVNLIVDPHAFGGSRDDDDDDDSDENDDEAGSVPGSFDPAAARRKRRRAKRRSVFAGLAMEEDWKRERSWLKKITAVDVVGIILWGGIFIFIIIGKRCPSGSFDGWCNAYNVSSAAACLLCVSFSVGVFFDVQDLHGSKVSPRTLT